MYVGVLRVRLHIPAAHSLKDRRMVVRKCVDRVRARTLTTVADVGPQDRWQVATLGICSVSNDPAAADEQLSKALAVIESAAAGAAEVTSRERELRRYDDHDFFGELSGAPLPRRAHDGEDDDDDRDRAGR